MQTLSLLLTVITHFNVCVSVNKPAGCVCVCVCVCVCLCVCVCVCAPAGVYAFKGRRWGRAADTTAGAKWNQSIVSARRMLTLQVWTNTQAHTHTRTHTHTHTRTHTHTHTCAHTHAHRHTHTHTHTHTQSHY